MGVTCDCLVRYRDIRGHSVARSPVDMDTTTEGATSSRVLLSLATNIGHLLELRLIQINVILDEQ